MNKDRSETILYICIGLFFTIWFALLYAPYSELGIVDALPFITSALNTPFIIVWCDQSIKIICLFITLYMVVIGIALSNQKNYRRLEEYGSAKWANISKVTKKYQAKDYFQNKLFSQNVRMGLDGKKHRRNLNSMVIGGSGSGKTRFYGKPNLMQCNTSFVVLDPKGGAKRSYLKRVGTAQCLINY